MAQPVPTNPTKMGEGRAIAVLTSGGDAQGKYLGIPDWYVRVNARAKHVCF